MGVRPAAVVGLPVVGLPVVGLAVTGVAAVGVVAMIEAYVIPGIVPSP